MKIKKVPMRSCVVTHEKCEKKDLIRVVRTNESEVLVDLTGKMNGRGAYIKKDIEVLEKAKDKKILSKALEREIPESVYKEIENIIKNN